MAKNIRIFQIAKDLNISHTEILIFLKKKGVEVASHMTPVNEDIQEMIKGEFRKERQDIDRFRKEQVRREIHQTRIDEQQKTQKKLLYLLVLIIPLSAQEATDDPFHDSVGKETKN